MAMRRVFSYCNAIITEFGIHAQQITDWKKQALNGLPSLIESTVVKPTLSEQQREQIDGP